MPDRALSRVQAVAETLRFLVSGGWLVHDDDRAWLREVLERMDAGVVDAPVCPLCEEATCDDGCPLAEVRRES